MVRRTRSSSTRVCAERPLPPRPQVPAEEARETRPCAGTGCNPDLRKKPPKPLPEPKKKKQKRKPRRQPQLIRRGGAYESVEDGERNRERAARGDRRHRRVGARRRARAAQRRRTRSPSSRPSRDWAATPTPSRSRPRPAAGTSTPASSSSTTATTPTSSALLDELGVCDPARPDELLGLRRARATSSGRPARWGCSPSTAPPLRPPLPPHARRPRSLQPRGARAGRHRTARAAPCATSARERGYSEYFVERLIVPQASAVWSARPEQLCAFPAASSPSSSTTTGLLQLLGRPQLALGRRRLAPLRRGDQRPFARPHAPRRRPSAASARDPRAASTVVDRCRPRELRRGRRRGRTPTRPGAARRPEPGRARGARRHPLPAATRRCCTPTRALLPRRRRAWASWNFHLAAEGEARGEQERTTVTYDMNRLQRLDAPTRFLVTLNTHRGDRPREGDPHS